MAIETGGPHRPREIEPEGELPKGRSLSEQPDRRGISALPIPPEHRVAAQADVFSEKEQLPKVGKQTQRGIHGLNTEASERTDQLPPAEHHVVFEPSDSSSDTPADAADTSEDEASRIRAEADATFETIRSGAKVKWQQMSGSVKREIMERIAADEGNGLPASMLEKSEFDKKRDILGGHTVGGLFQSAHRRGVEEDADAITILQAETGLVPTADEVAAAAQLGRKITWTHVPDDTVAEVLQRASEQTGMPVSLMGIPDLRSTKYDFLGGKTLSGVYARYDAIAKEEGRGTLAVISERTGQVPTATDVVQAMNIDREVDWKRVPNRAIKGILTRAAAEAGIPPSMLTRGDFWEKYEFLGDKSLQGLYRHVKDQREDPEQNVTAKILEQAGIKIIGKDVVRAIQAGRSIPWGRMPNPAIRVVLEAVAADESVNLPVSMLGEDDFRKHTDVLGGHSLTGFYDYAERAEKPEGQSTLDYIFERTGIEPSIQDVIEAAHRDRLIPWERVPGETLNSVLKMVATAQETDPALVSSSDLGVALPQLNGRSLKGLYGYAVRAKDEGETGMEFLKKKAGIDFDRGAIAAARKQSLAGRKERNDLLVQDIEFLFDEGIRSAAAISAELGIPEDEAREGIALLRARSNKEKKIL